MTHKTRLFLPQEWLGKSTKRMEDSSKWPRTVFVVLEQGLLLKTAAFKPTRLFLEIAGLGAPKGRGPRKNAKCGLG
jgi:hypothetical protein